MERRTCDLLTFHEGRPGDGKGRTMDLERVYWIAAGFNFAFVATIVLRVKGVF
jgi:hypothetical protein